jgi:integrase
MLDLSITDFLSRYSQEIRHSHKSYYSVVSVLKTFGENVPCKPLAALSPPDVHQYIQTRLEAGIRPNTINRELSVLSAAINHARQRWGVSMPNPIRHQWLKAGALRLRYLDRAESLRLISEAERLRDDLGDFVRLALNTGCRKTELLTLRWSDVNIERRFFVIRPENTKSNRRRAIPLNDQAVRALVARQAGNASEWVFAKRNGERVKALDWLFRKAVKSAGIEDFRIHDLRHTFASWLVSEGVELVKVRDLLGHTSIAMTERYAHLMPDRLLSAVQVLDMFADQ